MGNFLERLEIIIDANSAGAVKGLGETGVAAEGLGAKMGKLATGSGPLLIGATVAVGAAMIHAVGAYDKAHQSVLQLDNSLKNNAMLAGANRQQFLDLARALQDKTAADGDQIVSAEAMLGTFRMTGDQILALTPLVVDYARKFDVDLVTAAKSVGKAMDGNVGALKRNGVTIDEVKFKTDRYAAVQEALRGQVGGFAEAEGKTFQGRLETLKNKLGDIEEAIGQQVSPAMTKLAGATIDVVDGLVKLEQLSESILSGGGLFSGDLLEPLIKSVPGIGPALGLVYDGVGRLGDKQDDAAQSTDKHKTAAERLSVKLREQETALTATVNALWARISADLAAEGSMLSVESAANTYTQSLWKNGEAALDTREALNRYESAMVSASVAAGKAAAEALGPHAGAHAKEKAATEAQIATLQDLANNAAPAARQKINEYIATLNSIPGSKSVSLGADASGFDWQVGQLRMTLQNIGRSSAGPGLGAGASGFVRAFFAEGGIVSRPTLATVGEAGPEAIIPLSNPRRGAEVMRQAGLSGGGGSTVYMNFTVAPGADVIGFGRAAREAIAAYERRIGAN